MPARIQKRMITVVSGQPTSSKWWWIGRHAEDAGATAEAEAADLEDHRQRLDHEEAADDRQQQLACSW